MHCQCHFGKLKSSSCSSVDTAAAATLRYTYNGQEVLAHDTRRGYDHTDVFTAPWFYLSKYAILECIQILQLGLV